MLFLHRNLLVVALVITAAFPLQAQKKVTEFQWGDRIVFVAPVVGTGAYNDPKRPDLVPRQEDFGKLGIVSYRCEYSPTGDIAIVEIVARSRSGINSILQEGKKRPGVVVFERGNSEKKTKAERDTEKAAVETEFKKRKADFNLDDFLKGGLHVGRAAEARQ